VKTVAAVVAAVFIAIALAGCEDTRDATKIPTQFEIIGPENTLVEIVPIQNGERQDRTEAVIRRNAPGDRDAKAVINKDVLDTWEEGYRITAVVTLTNEGRTDERATTSVGLRCVTNRLDTNAKVAESTGKGSITCAANYSE
jgi:hypothetical protein